MRWLISSRSQRLYLIDTPGFLDTRISEMKVVLILKEWLKETDILIDHTLYFDRITDIRLNKNMER
ncbi:hypothetical protein BJ165DRAFT_1481171 [Panaeolus papilionaceus]|nr:hypothetical protein BJ165DRAFT_1481171 [Panaeolus papilionaceus]